MNSYSFLPTNDDVGLHYLKQIVGMRFAPTDRELIGYYLQRKNTGDFSTVEDVINEVNIYGCEPWELPKLSRILSKDPVYYFFTQLDKKFPNSNRNNRKTKEGYWKAGGEDLKIKDKGIVIGTKKNLVFHQGQRQNAKRTDWVMHEYHADFIPPDQRAYVICKVMYTGDQENFASRDGGRSSDSLASDSQNPASNITSEFNHQNVQATAESPLDVSSIDFDSKSWSELLQLCGALPSCPNHVASGLTTFVSVEDQKFLNELMFIDPKLVEHLFTNDDGFSCENFVHTQFTGNNLIKRAKKRQNQGPLVHPPTKLSKKLPSTSNNKGKGSQFS